jgi:hypothetical protein
LAARFALEVGGRIEGQEDAAGPQRLGDRVWPALAESDQGNVAKTETGRRFPGQQANLHLQLAQEDIEVSAVFIAIQACVAEEKNGGMAQLSTLHHEAISACGQ